MSDYSYNTGRLGRDIQKVVIRSGSSFAREEVIDPYISEEDCKVLYDRWKEAWGEAIVFQGGIKGITCEMIKAIQLDELVSVFGKGLSKRLADAANKYAVL